MIITKFDNYTNQLTQFIKKCGSTKLAKGLAALVSMVALIRLAKLSPLSRFQLLGMTLDLKNRVCQYIKSVFTAPNQFDHLPAEILDRILLYVDQPTKTALVCRRWRDASNNLSTDYIKSILAPHRWAEIFSPNVTTIELYKRAVNNLLCEARVIRLASLWEAIRTLKYTPTISVNCCEELQKSISEHNFLSFYDNLTDAPVQIRWLISGQWKDAREQFDLQIQDPRSSFATLTSLSITLGLNETTEIPLEIGQLQSLNYFNFSHGIIKALPREIGNLQSLIELDLSHNLLRVLPEEIGQLRTLEKLDLSYNKLKTLPREVGNLQSLKRLDLSHNLLETLPEEIGDLETLEILDLSDNQLTALPSKVVNLKKLVKFSIKNNPIPSLPPEILSIRALWRTAYLEATRT